MFFMYHQHLQNLSFVRPNFSITPMTNNLIENVRGLLKAKILQLQTKLDKLQQYLSAENPSLKNRVLQSKRNAGKMEKIITIHFNYCNLKDIPKELGVEIGMSHAKMD